jgi:hypothetical protein
MATVRCWSCNAENDPVATSGFCDRCGRKLEDVPDTGIADAPANRSPDARRDYPERDPYDLRLREDSLEARSALNTASGVLFAVAALQMICGVVVLAAAPAVLAVPGEAMIFMFVAVFGVGALFLGLGIWARYMPVPATIIGMVLYVIVFIGDAAIMFASGNFNVGIFIRIAIIFMLGKGISAANKYNQLQRREVY